MPTLTIQQTRGGSLESEHPIHAVLVRPDGTVIERVGEAFTTTMRSAAKPFQLEVALGLLAADVVEGLTDVDLAIGAASHSAQPRHIEAVRSLLAGFALDTDDLFCGAHWPMHEEAGRQLCRDGHALLPLHNNCSGKHSFMAAASRAQGWEPDYREPDHPLQQRIRACMESRTGNQVTNVVVDGCGVPCWVSSLDGFATAWAQLAAAMALPESPLGRIGWAMHRCYWYVSGDGRIDAAVTAHASRPVISKVGAAGLICMALPQDGLGLVLKVRSGDGDARAIAVSEVLARWFPGLLPADAVDGWRVVRNVVGKPVGERVGVWTG